MKQISHIGKIELILFSCTQSKSVIQEVGIGTCRISLHSRDTSPKQRPIEFPRSRSADLSFFIRIGDSFCKIFHLGLRLFLRGEKAVKHSRLFLRRIHHFLRLLQPGKHGFFCCRHGYIRTFLLPALMDHKIRESLFHLPDHAGWTDLFSFRRHRRPGEDQLVGRLCHHEIQIKPLHKALFPGGRCKLHGILF